MLYYLGRGLFRIIFRLFCRWEVEGRENVPESGGVILAPNHISFLDPPIAGSAVRRPTYFMAKRELFEVPVFGWIIRQTHAFPVNRGTADRQALRHAHELLTRGEVLVVFPEGRRSKDGRLQSPEIGLGLIAARAKVPVVPVAIEGSNRALPSGSLFLHPAKIKVKIGAPIFFENATNGGLSRQALEPFMDKIMCAIEAMLPESMKTSPQREELCDAGQ